MKLHIEKAHRSEQFRIQSENTESVAVTEGKGQHSWWKANGSCSKGDSCSFLHSLATGDRETSAEGAKNRGVSSLKPAVDNERRRKGKEQTSSSVPTGKGQTDDKRSKSLEARPATRAKIPSLWGWCGERGGEGGGGGARCRKSSCDYRHPPVCREYKSGNRCIYGNHCSYQHADGEEKPSKRSKSESTQGAVAILKHRQVQGCVKIQIQRSLFCGKLGKRD